MAAKTRRRKREEGTRLPLLPRRRAGDLRPPHSLLALLSASFANKFAHDLDFFIYFSHINYDDLDSANELQLASSVFSGSKIFNSPKKLASIYQT
jgi:hypothetical protein